MAVKVHTLDHVGGGRDDDDHHHDTKRRKRNHDWNKHTDKQRQEGKEIKRRDTAMTPHHLFDKHQNRVKELHDKIQKLRRKEKEGKTLTEEEQDKEFQYLSELLHEDVEEDDDDDDEDDDDEDDDDDEIPSTIISINKKRSDNQNQVKDKSSTKYDFDNFQKGTCRNKTKW